MQGKTRRRWGLVSLIFGVACLVFAVCSPDSEPVTLVQLSSHSYLRMVPAPSWQTSLYGVCFLALAAYLLMTSRTGRQEPDA
ncbi:hypothetical protein LVB77_07640 [Lysobacter sp. 5GHs7-4]|uniref:hypothetical protein n=1 Tax=Lysobacter sp. 5GHs7-4 TaxID=2904253 RepID=UPI001E3F1738|nr:hypothetical protein [Lysobacter sp. 5GHs7-4]UHQ24546.1 hypothetical protein LVB77_07640 [Lysobacter sp. 5GHs7-4]